MAEGNNGSGGNILNLWTLLNISSEGYVLCNSKGEIIYFNPKASEIIEKISGSLITSGDLFYYIVPEHARDSFNSSFQKALNGTPTETERNINIYNIGSYIFSVKYIPVKDNEGRVSYVCIMAKDITEEIHLKGALNFQREISEKLTGIVSIDTALKYILDLSIEKTGMDCGGIYLRNEDTEGFDLIVHKGISENFVNNTKTLIKGTKKWDSIMMGNRIKKQHWEYETNPEDILLKEDLKIVITTPVKYRDTILMSINIASHTMDYFPEKNNEILDIIALEAGNAVYRILTEEKLKQSLKIISEFKNNK